MKKAIQITIDEGLLKVLDEDPEIRAEGRSAVFQRVLSQYVKSKRRASIAQAYRRGYGKEGTPDLEGWADEGAWPEV